ncbi:helix-turn-helix domain-containing protein [Patulibacter defluvii]|uniref:helix-turn-helix domain-containing protein n=1 Tax=Patulibacter defluvii TaxID=3095358 RepID=UPI002A761031|nr:helix-turn-helix domain-containing protein [Patulibacter sp. DM4]
MNEQAVIDSLARTVRAARRQHGWSQDQLSGRAGVSKGALVAIENGTTNPSLSTLCRISDALQLPISAMLEQQPDGGVRIVDPDELTPLWRGPNGGTAALVLVTGGPAPVELWRWRLAPGEGYDNVPYPEPVGKTLTVTAGALTLTVDGREQTVREGATAAFSGAAEHRYGGGPDGASLLVTTHLPLGGGR